jgi:DNA-binding SARP family transcriptional activator
MWAARSGRIIAPMDTHRRHPCATTTTSTPSGNTDERTSVTITLLGGFGVAVDGIATPDRGWTRRSAAALVKVLALAPGHYLHREQVMDLLWPDQSPARCAPRLHKAAHFARQGAGRSDAIVLRGDVVWLFPDAVLTVDAIVFEQLTRDALRDSDPVAARAALALYGGELLPGDLYDDWASDRRELLRLRRLDVLRVAGEWRELAELDPTDEEAHVELVRRHLAAGAGAAALYEYEHLERVRDRELGGEVRRDAGSRRGRSPVGELLSELAELMGRQRVVLAELDALGATPPWFVPLAGAA